MPSPFLPSPLSKMVQTAPSLEQDTGVVVLGPLQPMDPRNPLYKTDAESSIAPFLRRNMEKPLPDPRAYVVLPGGRTAYKPGREP